MPIFHSAVLLSVPVCAGAVMFASGYRLLWAGVLLQLVALDAFLPPAIVGMEGAVVPLFVLGFVLQIVWWAFYGPGAATSPVRQKIRKWAKFPFVLVATAVVLFEEFVWDKLQLLMAALARLPVFREIEAWMGSLGKWGSLALFVLPEFVLIPAKFFAMWLIGNHHAFAGIVTFAIMKIAGTAVFARLWKITEPKVTQFWVVRKTRDLVTRLLAWAHGWIREQAFYRATKEAVAKIRERLRAEREHWMKRRLRAAKKAVRKGR